jgi:hypothetical protein
MKDALKGVVTEALENFNFRYSNDQDRLYDEDDDDFLSGEMERNNEGATSNFYKKEMREVKKRHAGIGDLDNSEVTSSTSSQGHSTDDNSSMTSNIVKHRNYIKPTTSKNTMCSTRAAMESIAYRSQMRQAKQVNERRLMDETYKQVLEVGDIGVVYVKPKTRNTCDHPYLPVMVTRLSISDHSQTVSYKLCCKYGPLRGTYLRESIRFEEHLTQELVQIPPTDVQLQMPSLTVEEASAKHNILGGKAYCRCSKDCALVPKCSCMALGRLCRDKCHGGANNPKKFRCSNCMHSTTEGNNGEHVGNDHAVRSKRRRIDHDVRSKRKRIVY